MPSALWPSETAGAAKTAEAAMKYIPLALVLFMAAPAAAQAPQAAPGWFVTGEWQCGPHVRIITSTDGGDGIDFLVIGAWFDNHYTLRRGQLYYRPGD
jgi:hypothetical protein